MRDVERKFGVDFDHPDRGLELAQFDIVGVAEPRIDRERKTILDHADACVDFQDDVMTTPRCCMAPRGSPPADDVTCPGGRR